MKSQYAIVTLAVMFLGTTAHSLNPLFDKAVEYNIGYGQVSLIAADLDGDGDSDLVVANAGAGNISVLENNGAGKFAEAIHYATGTGPRSVCAADLDADDDVDLAVANAGSDNISILFNNGDGTFAETIKYGAGDRPRSVSAADLDGDGDYDLATANWWSDDISILFNDGNGTYSMALNYHVDDRPSCLFASDLDGDSDIDLAIISIESDNISVLRNNGDGTFASPVGFNPGCRPGCIYAADVDQDSDNDLVVGCTVNSVSILTNNGTGLFETGAAFEVGSVPRSICVNDLNGDELNDLVVGYYEPANSIAVLINAGNGTFSEAREYKAGDRPNSICAADLDGDTDYDLAVANAGCGYISVFLNRTTVREVVADEEMAEATVVKPLRKEPAPPVVDWDDRQKAINKLKTGKLVRLHTAAGGESKGIYGGCVDDTVILGFMDMREKIPTETIKSLWVRGRSTKTGALIGGIVGAVGGALLGGLAAGISSMEGGTTSTSGAMIGGFALGGAVLGAVGAGIGATIPKWHRRYRAPDYDKKRHYEKRSVAVEKSKGSHGIGGLRVLGGYSRSTWSSEPAGGLGGQANYFIQISRTVLVGPDVGYYMLGDVTHLSNFSAACLVIKGQKYLRYFGIADIGYYNWKGVAENMDFLGYGIGGGIIYRIADNPLALYAEGRLQSDLGGWDTDGPAIFITTAAGVQLSW